MTPDPIRRDSDAPDGLERLVRESRRYRKGRSAARLFRQLTRLATPGAVFLLTVAFLSRILWPPLIFSLLLLPVWVLVVAGYIIVRPGLWAVPAWQAGARADLHSGSRGLFMALEVARSDDWTGSLGRTGVALPVGFPSAETLRWLGGAVVLVAVLLLPDLRPRPLQPLAAVTPLDRMEDLVATLREEELAEEDYLERVEQVLQELRRERTKSLRAEDWQALDGFREDLKRQTLDSYRRLQESDSQLAALRRALNRPGEPTPDQLRELAERLGKRDSADAAQTCAAAAAACGLNAEELREFLQKCKAGDFGFSQKELELLRSLCQGCPLSADQLRRLAELLEGLDLEKLAATCGQMKLCELSVEDIKKLLGACKSGTCSFTPGDLAALRALLLAAQSQCQGKCKSCCGLLARLGLPGRGGVSRGPGPAPLLGAGDTEPDFGGFQSKAFSGRLSGPEVPLGFAFAPPDDATMEEGAESDAPGPAVEFGTGNERITWHSRLLPRHHDVMKRYFAEDTGGEPE